MSSETNSPLASMLIRFTVLQVGPAPNQGPGHYSVGLQADGLDTGIWYDGLTEQEADEQAALMLAEAPQLLTFYGVHEEVYALCHAQRALAATGLQVGDVVRLSRDAKGLPGAAKQATRRGSDVHPARVQHAGQGAWKVPEAHRSSRLLRKSLQAQGCRRAWAMRDPSLRAAGHGQAMHRHDGRCRMRAAPPRERPVRYAQHADANARTHYQSPADDGARVRSP